MVDIIAYLNDVKDIKLAKIRKNAGQNPKKDRISRREDGVSALYASTSLEEDYFSAWN